LSTYPLVPVRTSRNPLPSVILDANILILAVETRFPLDTEIARILGQVDVLVPSSVSRELKRLERKGLKSARAAIRFAARYRIFDTDLDGDAAMETLGRELDGWVVTLDRELRSRLEEHSVGVLFPCGQQRLCASREPIPTRRGDGSKPRSDP
jgi:rRNA-processing protein FCF1